MLSNAELTAIRADINQLLPDTGYILSVSNTPDGAGGVSESVGTASTVSYRLDPKTSTYYSDGSESVKAGALMPFHSFMLTLPYDTNINTNNRFKDKDGNIYNVISVDDPKSWIASVRCMVELR